MLQGTLAGLIFILVGKMAITFKQNAEFADRLKLPDNSKLLMLHGAIDSHRAYSNMSAVIWSYTATVRY